MPSKLFRMALSDSFRQTPIEAELSLGASQKPSFLGDDIKVSFLPHSGEIFYGIPTLAMHIYRS